MACNHQSRMLSSGTCRDMKKRLGCTRRKRRKLHTPLHYLSYNRARSCVWCVTLQLEQRFVALYSSMSSCFTRTCLVVRRSKSVLSIATYRQCIDRPSRRELSSFSSLLLCCMYVTIESSMAEAWSSKCNSMSFSPGFKSSTGHLSTAL